MKQYEDQPFPPFTAISEGTGERRDRGEQDLHHSQDNHCDSGYILHWLIVLPLWPHVPDRFNPSLPDFFSNLYSVQILHVK